MIQINIDMPNCCHDCFAFRVNWGDEYIPHYDYCKILQRRFNTRALDIDPFKERLSDCPLIGVDYEATT